MDYRIERTFSTSETFEPRPWLLSKVRPVIDDEGKVLAYCGMESSETAGTRSDLPTEIFNHQLKDLDLSNSCAVADFMTVYGMIGWHGTSRYNMGFYLMNSRYDFSNYVSILKFEEDYNFEVGLNPVEKDALTYYQGLLKGLHQVVSEEDNSLSRINCIVSNTELSQSVWKLQRCVRIAKAIMQSDDPSEIARLADVSLSELDREIQDSDAHLNFLLREVSPKIGAKKIVDGKVHSLLHNGLTLDELGSFEQAVALQLWEFALKGGSYRICKECGEVFQQKQSKARKSTARSDSDFCCEKCRNRFTQREHRKTDGYKLKQQKIREQKQKAKSAQ